MAGGAGHVRRGLPPPRLGHDGIKGVSPIQMAAQGSACRWPPSATVRGCSAQGTHLSGILTTISA
jgi:hypothetical protein